MRYLVRNFFFPTMCFLYRFSQPQQSINDEFLMNYFITHKKLPAMLEKEIIDNERIPQILEPSGTTCSSCDSNIDSCCTAISSKATVYGSGKLLQGLLFYYYYYFYLLS